MRVQAKLISLLLFFSAIFIAGRYWYQAFENKRMYLLFQSDNKEKTIYFDKIVKLEGVNLEVFAIDYTYWDEMADAIRKNDLEWAKKMMDETVLKTYKADAVWVYNTNFSLFYSINSQYASVIKESPIPKEAINEIFLKKRLCHFFVNTSAGIIEIRGATVHLTSDPERKTPPQGYFFVGRLWKSGYVSELGELMGGEIKVGTKKETIPGLEALAAANSIIFSRELADWRGNPIAYVYVTIQSQELQTYKLFSRNASAVFIVFLVCVIIFMALFITTTVNIPLGIISGVLKKDDPAGLRSLEKDTSEFGDISRLIRRFFKQKQELIQEIAERKKVEDALKENEAYFTVILNSLPVGMVVIDSETHIIAEANPAAARMIGADKSQIVGKLCYQYICPAEKGKCPVSGLGQNIEGSERVLLRANGDRVPILKTVISVTLKGRKYLLESFMDIADRKKTEEQQKVLLKDLEDMNKIMVGRELKMIELKQEINRLSRELGRQSPYNEEDKGVGGENKDNNIADSDGA
ncbi:MAG: PAS domain S-box protein [Candidatus Omnitrophica bacterium]|nr:PAS domain S-box protein [Candidatus Omnitrophota bacterium]